MASATFLPPAFLVIVFVLLSGCGQGKVEKQPAARAVSNTKPPRAEKIDFLIRQPIGDPIGEQPPWITHLAVVDLDGNGTLDVVFSDAREDVVRWIAQNEDGAYSEKIIGDPIKGPTHLTANDIDQDGDLDVLVASMGNIFPTNDEIGAVVVLENDGEQNFINRYLAEGVARVTDLEAADFDGDGDTDLVAGQFGYDTGEIRWMENLGDWLFRSHRLLDLAGTIHTPIADMDGDGDLDVVALVSQEWEEIHVFANDGKGAFTNAMVYGSTNEDFGSSGISLADLDGDGDMDILYTNGDSFDYLPPGPRPWHGLQWLENKGGLRFTFHRIDDFSGAASAAAADIDGDSDLDIIAVSSLGQDENARDSVMIWFENDGKMQYTRRDISDNPSHLIVIAPADMDGDGRMDFVTGGFHTAPPHDRLSRITVWQNRWPGQPESAAAIEPGNLQ